MLARFVLCLIMHVLGFRSLSFSTSDNNLSIKWVVGVNTFRNANVVVGITAILELNMFSSGVSGKNVNTLAIVSFRTNDSEIGIKEEDIIEVGLGVRQLLCPLKRRREMPTVSGPSVATQ